MSSNSRPDGQKAMNVLVGVILLIAFVGYVVLSRPSSRPDATELPEGEFKRAVLASDVPVLVDFYADWCGPCRKMSSVIDEFADGNPNIKIMRINVEVGQPIALRVPYSLRCSSVELYSTCPATTKWGQAFALKRWCNFKMITQSKGRQT